MNAADLVAMPSVVTAIVVPGVNPLAKATVGSTYRVTEVVPAGSEVGKVASVPLKTKVVVPIFAIFKVASAPPT